MLYGISTSFPVLSRLERQVAHALLTRPPLTRPRRVSSVRLECVMHAASVHPEPGSNSRLKSLYLSYLLFYCSHLGIVEISWLPSFLSFLNFSVLSVVLSSFVLSLNRCSIFKDQLHSLRFLSGERLTIISHTFTFVKHFFKSFLIFLAYFSVLSVLRKLYIL